jgi:hypothetical protein
MVTPEMARAIALSLPQAEEGSHYGTPAFRVRGRLFARLREDGTMAVRVDRGYRDVLVNAGPDRFFVTPHYQDYPWMLVRLEAVGPQELDDLLADAWAEVAPKRLAATLLATA